MPGLRVRCGAPDYGTEEKIFIQWIAKPIGALDSLQPCT